MERIVGSIGLLRQHPTATMEVVQITVAVHLVRNYLNNLKCVDHALAPALAPALIPVLPVLPVLPVPLPPAPPPNPQL